MSQAMRIGKVAQLAGVSPDTIRHYERSGLLPTIVRTSGGYRIYSRETVKRIRMIRSALAVGFTINELARVFRIRKAGGTPCSEVRMLAEEKLLEVEQRIRDLDQTRRDLKSIIRQWDRIMRQAVPGEPAGLLEVLVPKTTTGEF